MTSVAGFWRQWMSERQGISRFWRLHRKSNPSPVGAFGVKDECDMVLIGYLAFLDPPKESTADAIKALKDHGVTTKILTGDNDKVTRTICKQVGDEGSQYASWR